MKSDGPLILAILFLAAGLTIIFAYGNGTAVAVRQNGRREGSAILTGPKGTIVTCEFDLGLSGHGFGACKSNGGVFYKMLF